MNGSACYRPGRRILEVARSHPDRIALVIDGESWSYAELLSAAGQIAASFPLAAADQPQPVTAVMAARHVSSYAGILAARLSGHAYVPLNVNHPGPRNAAMLEASAAGRVVCGSRSADKLQEILAATAGRAENIAIIRCGDAKTDYATRSAAAAPVEFPIGRETARADLAYILFTSGSTGNPKGVPIGNAQLESYLKAAGAMLDVRAADRFSQTFDLTFDLSVHDLFVCWENGATLVVPSQHELRKAADFVRAQGITCWFSVPSLAYQMRLQEDLAPGAFPQLRTSLFCGEALPATVAVEWAAAAPNSTVENWYGPTEATIACSRYVLDGEPLPDDTVPIGRAFDDMELIVLDDKLAACPPGVPGALFLAGAQVAGGYLNDPEKTAAAFVTLPDGQRAYRTGDRAVLGTDGNFRFLGRVDNQIKIRGYRIELGEIEAALRNASAGKNSVALAWPPGAETVTSIVAALETDSADIPAIQAQLRAALPDYMVPAAIFAVPEFPKNANGKVDRKALAGQLDERTQNADRQPAPPLSREGEILLQAILAHAPLLDCQVIVSAPNLFDAGMDSLAFTGLTMELERHFQLPLDQDKVVQLSEMSFDEIVEEVRGENTGPAADHGGRKRSLLGRLKHLLRPPSALKPRANRAVQFIERFPGYLAERGAPDVLAFGSSGTFRAFSPLDFQAAAVELGVRVTALNAGLPAVNVAGLRRLCEFVRDRCRAAGDRIPLVLYELDPMHVSTTPPHGDIHLGPEFFRGEVPSIRSGTSREFEWDVEAAGTWNPPDASRPKDRKPNWVRDRDRVVAAAYLGQIEFVAAAVADWLAGARALQEISASMVCFIHPADRTMTDELAATCTSDKLARFTAEAAGKLGIAVLPWQAFELEPGDFLDINHVNAHAGRAKLNRQLAAMLYSRPAPRPAHAPLPTFHLANAPNT